jgi:broad specificity phosphatase PhoE
MPTRLLLIRHGATPLTAEDRFAGSSDPPLSPEGLAQAAAASRRLAREPIAAIYASPMRRAAQTAEAIAAPHGLAPIPMPDLREIDHGRWEGLRQEEVLARFAGEHAQWSRDPFTFAPEGGETGLSVLARALPAVRRIVLAHPDRTAAAVSHKGTIRLIVTALLGIDPRRYRDYLAQDLACLNILSFETFDRPRLIVWNDASHCAPR